jgi:dihydropteroate synthase
MDLSRPQVMGILNVTPDSFYGASRHTTEEGIAERVRQIVEEGATIIDVGAYSSRPGADDVSEAEEMERLRLALKVVRSECPDAVVSVDTFRGRVAMECVRNHNVSIINDVSGWEWDSAMFDAVAALNVPYVLTHSVGWAGGEAHYDSFLRDVLAALSVKMWQLRSAGVKDVIVDPGFGFGKTVEQNYAMLAALPEFEILEAPLLVGVSRKSMITKLLDITSAEALAPTTAVNMAALMGGANILRVHDVKEAVQAVKLYEAMAAARAKGENV